MTSDQARRLVDAFNQLADPMPDYWHAWHGAILAYDAGLGDLFTLEDYHLIEHALITAPPSCRRAHVGEALQDVLRRHRHGHWAGHLRFWPCMQREHLG
jgi:hypothetical protein